MREFPFPLVTMPVVSAGCFAALTDGENWIGIEREQCSWVYVDDTGEYGYQEELDCDKEKLPYAEEERGDYSYSQVFLDIKGDVAIFSYMSAGSYDDTVYGSCKSILMSYKRDGDTYELEFDDEELECELKDDELECEDMKIVFEKTSSAFNYEDVLQRIHDEYQ